MRRLASLTTSDLEPVTGGQSLSEALARGYAPSDDMRQPNTVAALRNLPATLAAAANAAMSGSAWAAASGIARGLADVSIGQIKDAFNGQGAPIIPPGL